jgi:hypothetical protein
MSESVALSVRLVQCIVSHMSLVFPAMMERHGCGLLCAGTLRNIDADAMAAILVKAMNSLFDLSHKMCDVFQASVEIGHPLRVSFSESPDSPSLSVHMLRWVESHQQYMRFITYRMTFDPAKRISAEVFGMGIVLFPELQGDASRVEYPAIYMMFDVLMLCIVKKLKGQPDTGTRVIDLTVERFDAHLGISHVM